MSNALLRFFKRKSASFLVPVVKPFAWFGIHPLVLTFFSLVCGVLAVVFIERKFYFILLSVLSLVFDILDGNLARFIKKETEFGRFADNAADRSVEFLLIIAAPVALGLKLVTGVLFLAQQLLFLKTKTMFFGRTLLMIFFAFGLFELGVMLVSIVYVLGILWQLKKLLKG